MPIFPNINFLLILWEFHFPHPNHTHFPILHACPRPLWPTPQKKTNKDKDKRYKNKKVKFVLSVYSLEHAQNLTGLTLK